MQGESYISCINKRVDELGFNIVTIKMAAFMGASQNWFLLR